MSKSVEDIEKIWNERFERLAQAIYRGIDACMKDGTHDDCTCLFSATAALVSEMRIVRAKFKEALTAERKRAEDAEAENKRLREALRYIYDNCDSEQEKWAEQTAKEALGGEV